MRALVLLAFLLPCVACDQAAKLFAVDHLKGAGEVKVVDGMFRLVYAENPGAFLGLGRNLPDTWRVAVFAVGVALLLAGVAIVVARKKLAPAVFLGLALLVAGGVGNLADRIARPGGRVVDFAVLSVGPLSTGIFNVADVQIMLGAALIALGARKQTAVAASASTSS